MFFFANLNYLWRIKSTDDSAIILEEITNETKTTFQIHHCGSGCHDDNDFGSCT